MRYSATLERNGATATGIAVPPDVLEALGAGKRPAVRVTINGYTYRTTIGSVDGAAAIPVSAEHRANAGLSAGDRVDVEVEVDRAPRELVVPDDLAAALDAEPAARQTFDGLSRSNRSWHVLSVEGARTDETRRRRIEKSVAILREGRAR